MDQTTVNPAQVQHAMVAMVPIIGFFVILIHALVIVPFWFAFKKAGLSPWLSLLVFVPVIGFLVPLYILAFAQWRVTPLAAEYPAYPAPGGYAQQAYPAPVQTAAPSAYPPVPERTYPPVDPPTQV